MKTSSVSIAAATAVAFLSLYCRADVNYTTNSYPFLIQCTGLGQECDRALELDVYTESTLYAQYTAAETHCSPVIIHFLIDGSEVALPVVVDPGQSTGFVLLKIEPHTCLSLTIKGEGVEEGCNPGTLESWGGVVDIVKSFGSPGDVQLGFSAIRDDIVLSWRISGSNYVLQSSETIPGCWTTVTQVPVQLGDDFYVTNKISAFSRFYRLWRR